MQQQELMAQHKQQLQQRLLEEQKLKQQQAMAETARQMQQQELMAQQRQQQLQQQLLEQQKPTEQQAIAKEAVQQPRPEQSMSPPPTPSAKRLRAGQVVPPAPSPGTMSHAFKESLQAMELDCQRRMSKPAPQQQMGQHQFVAPTPKRLVFRPKPMPTCPPSLGRPAAPPLPPFFKASGATQPTVLPALPQTPFQPGLVPQGSGKWLDQPVSPGLVVRTPSTLVDTPVATAPSPPEPSPILHLWPLF